MSTQSAAVMVSQEGGRIALQGVNVDAVIRDLLAEVTVTQTYKNKESVNIEAVYTFPLPTHATLLGLTVTLGERALKGVIVEKTEAEDRYEDAITDGDSAIMLQQLGSGLYTMNVGNLQAGESAVICFRYAILQQWSSGHLRFMLPTTIAPRYGDPASQGLLPHQQPEYDLGAEQGYSLRIVVNGLLEGGKIDSPSHDLSIARTDAGTIIQLARGSVTLDRDFVMNVHVDEVQPAGARVEPDIEGYVALASFKPEFANRSDEAPKSIKIVVDCSGSMGGDSIQQARDALQRILESLRPQDHFNILVFGSHYEMLFPSQVPVNNLNLEQAFAFVREIDANMGGTEIRSALQAAFRLPANLDVSPDLLLITDGDVWNSDELISEAKESGHRIFTVGVGTSVAEAFVRELAEECNGMCELVSPNENMAERIHRQFERMYSPDVQTVAVNWPVNPKARFPEDLGPVFHGDTVHAFAWFEQPPRGDVRFVITLPDGRQISQSAEIMCGAASISGEGKGEAVLPGTLARLAAAMELPQLDKAQIVDLATRYQLISQHTHYLIIDERVEADKARELPELRKVPQMLAAGWGGSGTVINASVVHVNKTTGGEDYDRPTVLRHKTKVAQRAQVASGHSFDDDISFLDIPAFLRKEGDADYSKSAAQSELSMIVGLLNQQPNRWFVPLLRFNSISILSQAGINESVLVALREVVDEGMEEEAVIIVFLYMVAESRCGKNLDRDKRRAIIKVFKDSKHDKKVVSGIKNLLVEGLRWDDFVSEAIG